MTTVGEPLDRLLAEHPVTRGLSQDDVALMAGCARNVRFEPGQYLFREGEAAEHVYLLRQGRVALEVHAPARLPLVVQTLSGGEIVGWSWFFPPYQWHFDARAVEPTRALQLNAECLRGKCESDPRFGYELLKRISSAIVDRLQATRMQLLDVYGQPSHR
jgi:CRP-like cAMP-binding protein